MGRKRRRSASLPSLAMGPKHPRPTSLLPLDALDDLVLSRIFRLLMAPVPSGGLSPAALCPRSSVSNAFALARTSHRFLALFANECLRQISYRYLDFPFATGGSVLALENKYSFRFCPPASSNDAAEEGSGADEVRMHDVTWPRHVAAVIGLAGHRLEALTLKTMYGRHRNDGVMMAFLLQTALACCPKIRRLSFRFDPRWWKVAAGSVRQDSPPVCKQVRKQVGPIPALLAELALSVSDSLETLEVENANSLALWELATVVGLGVKELTLKDVGVCCVDVHRLLAVIGGGLTTLRLSFDTGMSHGKWRAKDSEGLCENAAACMSLIPAIPKLCPAVQWLGLGHMHRRAIESTGLASFQGLEHRILYLHWYPVLAEVQLVDQVIDAGDMTRWESKAPQLTRVSLVNCDFSTNGALFPVDSLLAVWGKLGKRLVQLSSVSPVSLLQADEGSPRLEVACPNIESLSFITGLGETISRQRGRRACELVVGACVGLGETLVEVDFSACLFEDQYWLLAALKDCKALETLSLPIFMSSGYGPSFYELMREIGCGIRVLRYKQQRYVPQQNCADKAFYNGAVSERLTHEKLLQPVAEFCTSLEILDVEPRALMKITNKSRSTGRRIASMIDLLQENRPNLCLGRVRRALGVEISKLW